MTVRQVLARVPVADLDAALPLYRALAGADSEHRFTFGAITLARVGPFLLLTGPPDALARVARTATLLVDDISAVEVELRAAGAEILEAPAPGPNGARMIAVHPDGAVFEYIEGG